MLNKLVDKCLCHHSSQSWGSKSNGWGWHEQKIAFNGSYSQNEDWPVRAPCHVVRARFASPSWSRWSNPRSWPGGLAIKSFKSRPKRFGALGLRRGFSQVLTAGDQDWGKLAWRAGNRPVGEGMFLSKRLGWQTDVVYLLRTSTASRLALQPFWSCFSSFFFRTVCICMHTQRCLFC